MSVNVSRGQARDSPARWDRIEASDLSVSVSNNIVCTGRLATWMRQRKGLCDQEGVGCKKPQWESFLAVLMTTSITEC